MPSSKHVPTPTLLPQKLVATIEIPLELIEPKLLLALFELCQVALEVDADVVEPVVWEPDRFPVEGVEPGGLERKADDGNSFWVGGCILSVGNERLSAQVGTGNKKRDEDGPL